MVVVITLLPGAEERGVMNAELRPDRKQHTPRSGKLRCRILAANKYGPPNSAGKYPSLCEGSGPPTPEHGRVVVHVAEVAEPYFVSSQGGWVSNNGAKVALIFQGLAGSPPFEKGTGFVFAFLTISYRTPHGQSDILYIS